MRQEFRRNIKPFISPLGDRVAEVDGVPIDDDCGEQVEAGDTIVLAFSGAVTDFALATDAQRVLERMVGSPVEVEASENPSRLAATSFALHQEAEYSQQL